MDEKYEVKQKTAAGKWHSFGNVKRNQYGNYSLGMKATPQLKEIFANAEDGAWVNFSLFEPRDDKPEYKPKQPPVPPKYDEDSEIPF